MMYDYSTVTDPESAWSLSELSESRLGVSVSTPTMNRGLMLLQLASTEKYNRGIADGSLELESTRKSKLFEAASVECSDISSTLKRVCLDRGSDSHQQSIRCTMADDQNIIPSSLFVSFS